jgi:hypothetical protein
MRNAWSACAVWPGRCAYTKVDDPAAGMQPDSEEQNELQRSRKNATRNIRRTCGARIRRATKGVAPKCVACGWRWHGRCRDVHTGAQRSRSQSTRPCASATARASRSPRNTRHGADHATSAIQYGSRPTDSLAYTPMGAVGWRAPAAERTGSSPEQSPIAPCTRGQPLECGPSAALVGSCRRRMARIRD